MALVDHWPLFGLTLRAEDLVLRIPTDEDLVTLVELAQRGVHDPGFMPFAVPWTDVPADEFSASFLRYHWSTRASCTPETWRLEFIVERNGEIVGSQGLMGARYLSTRTVESGSWLGLSFQGQGIGKTMRRAILHFAFEQLQVDRVTSSAFFDNPSSAAVSLATGYEKNGTDVMSRRGVPSGQQKFVITRDRWLATRGDFTVTVEGFDACRPLLIG
jgi:RimJ/RimL family protein N-acetyltransferase